LTLLPQLSEASVNLTILDLPFNAKKQYEGAFDDGLPDNEYVEWYSEVVNEVYRVMSDGYVYVFCTTPQLFTLRPIYERVGFSWLMMLIWHGPNYSSNSKQIRGQWRTLYEPIMMFQKGRRLPMLNERSGYNSDAVLRFPRPQSNFVGHQKREHVAQKPMGLYETLIARTPGDVVLDPSVGSGTCAMAAKRLRRDFYAFELEAEYVALARRRLASVRPLPELLVPSLEQGVML
jgi:DNA modification methylase